MNDTSYKPNKDGFEQALDALMNQHEAKNTNVQPVDLPEWLPENGIGEHQVLQDLEPIVLGRATPLSDEYAFAHMDPPTPWITWATTMWNASRNQNMLHPDISPAARQMEKKVIQWLSPYFGMEDGHMTPGSTISNLTALWAARELKGVKRVVASEDAHLSIAKSAHILGLQFESVKINQLGQLDVNSLPEDLSDAVLVLTAGTTNAGAIDSLALIGRAAWSHVDAAWAGPLRLSEKYTDYLAGVEQADSISVSAHKWFFQPKDSGLILFKEGKEARDAVSFGGAYLATPNVGVLGSRGANAIPLLATLLAWGRSGVASRIERAMALADVLYECIDEHPKLELFAPNQSGVVLWRIKGELELSSHFKKFPQGSASMTNVNGQQWFRNVAANPCANIDDIWREISQVIDSI